MFEIHKLNFLAIDHIIMTDTFLVSYTSQFSLEGKIMGTMDCVLFNYTFETTHNNYDIILKESHPLKRSCAIIALILLPPLPSLWHESRFYVNNYWNTAS